jgi:hypothetical protein
MSTEDKGKIATDVFKVVMYISLSISSFLLVSNYNNAIQKLDKISDKIEQIEVRVIRVEYELKLK